MRAKLEIVPRPDVGRVDAGGVQAELRRERYQESLASDLGVAPVGRRERTAPPPSSISSGTVVLALIAAVITFVLVLGIMMWREGSLPRLWPERGFDFAPKGPTTDWVAGGKGEAVVVRKAHGSGNTVAPAPDTPVDAKAEYDAANPKPPPDEDGNE
jgi:hypothetical protein